MKLTLALSSLLVLLPLLSQAASLPALSARQNQGANVNRQQNNRQQGNNNNGNNNNNNNGGAAAGGAANGGAAAGGAAAGGAAAGGAAAAPATDDPDTSLCLDPGVINQGSFNDGQDVPTAGQVASATSQNNFINFCVGQTLTNGQQVEAGSCNPIPMGKIVPKANMPSAKFVSPKNLDVIAPDTQFTIQMAINNLQTGNFVNAQANYFSAPADLNGQQILIGHSHVTVEEIGSLTNTEPLNPTIFAFFKGLNAAAQGGVLSADVTNGLPAGTYRMCSINSAANHQPALVAVAQHGSLDDCSYFVVSNQGVGTNIADVAAGAAAAGGAANGGAAAGGAANGGAAAGGAAAGGAANGGAAAGGAAAGGAAAGGAAAGGAANGGAAAGGAANGGAAAGGAANGQNGANTGAANTGAAGAANGIANGANGGQQAQNGQNQQQNGQQGRGGQQNNNNGQQGRGGQQQGQQGQQGRGGQQNQQNGQQGRGQQNNGRGPFGGFGGFGGFNGRNGRGGFNGRN